MIVRAPNDEVLKWLYPDMRIEPRCYLEIEICWDGCVYIEPFRVSSLDDRWVYKFDSKDRTELRRYVSLDNSDRKGGVMKQLKPEEWRELVRNKMTFLSERRPSMSDESKYQPVLTIRCTEGGRFEAELAAPLCGVGYGDTVADALMDVAQIVEQYRARQSYEGRIAEIDKQIQQLQIERQALVDSEAEDLPIYSLLDEADRALYAANNKGLDPKYINWFEERYNKTIVAIHFIASPFKNIYGTPLIWQWAVVSNKDDDNKG